METTRLNLELNWNQIRLCTSNEKRLFVEEYAKDLQEVAYDGFNSKISFSPLEVRKTVDASNLIYLLQDLEGKLHGFLFASSEQKVYCYLGKFCVRRSTQGLGKGREILEFLKYDLQYKVVCLLTQNPNLIKLIYDIHKNAYPISKDYGCMKVEMPFLLPYVQVKVPQLQQVDLKNFSGVIYNHYGKQLGEIVLSASSTTISEQLATNFDFDVTRGDSVFICATV